MRLPDHAKGLLLTTAGVLILTPDSLLVRLIEADHWTIMFWRGLLSGIFILVALAFVYRGKFLENIYAIGKPGIAFAIIFGLGNVCFVISVFMTTVANVLFLYASSPLISAALSPLYLKEPVSRPTWIAIIVALFGVGVIVSGSAERGGQSLLGDALALGASISVAATFLIARKHRDRSMVPAMGFSGFATAVIALPFISSFAVGAGTEIHTFLIGFIVAAAMGLMIIGPRYLPAPEVGLLLLLEAVIGPYWVYLVLGEDPGSRALVGGFIVIMTLVVLNSYYLVRNRGKRS